ncbi:MAG: P1 family peptidase [Cardiobacteriaceae bacterium]|nr:P1 family peptidase [Cardiobacteriaceae bacterium]
MTYPLPLIGNLPSGQSNHISDVSGVRVGHCTLDEGKQQTGVSVILPADGNLFLQKIPAAATIINGFGKSMGLMQLQELGQLETPIALTNTFAVPAVAQAQIEQAIQDTPEIGRTLSTINPLVLECNDGYLNDLQAFAIKPQHYQSALHDAKQNNLAQGSIGAGRGMSCFGFKGGIGSASRLIDDFVVGAMVLANFGREHQAQLAGYRLKDKALCAEPDKGSIIMIIATDAPLDTRQLRRLSMRAAAGLARTGSNYGHGSGDISLAFSTAYRISHLEKEQSALPMFVHESRLDALFDAAAEAVEQSIIKALWTAETVHGRDGHIRENIVPFLHQSAF